jgi:hypothetical protein
MLKFLRRKLLYIIDTIGNIDSDATRRKIRFKSFDEAIGEDWINVGNDIKNAMEVEMNKHIRCIAGTCFSDGNAALVIFTDDEPKHYIGKTLKECILQAAEDINVMLVE